MDNYRKWVDEPWRQMSSAVRGPALAAILVVAYVVDHAIGDGGTGFVVGLVVALLLAVLVPLCWQAFRR